MPIPSGSNEGNPVVSNIPCVSSPTRPGDGSDGGNRGGASPKPPPVRNAPPPGPKPPPIVVEPTPPVIIPPDRFADQIPPVLIPPDLVADQIPPVLIPPKDPFVIKTNDNVWITSNNLLSNYIIPRSSYTESVVDDSIIFIPTNGAYDIFDRGYNLDIESNLDILSLANVRIPTIMDTRGLLNDFINLTLSNLLDSKNDPNIPYNGVSVGSILYQSNLLKSSLATEAGKILEDIKKFNITSLHTSTYVAQGLLRAAINGTLENYSLEFLREIAEAGLRYFPRGIPYLSTPLLNRPVAYGMLETRRESLNPADHVNGTASRIAQMSYIIPTDIDLTLKIITLGGGESGVRVDMAGNLELITTSGTTVEVGENGHEFLEIITQQNKVTTVTLNSLRNESYQYSIPDLSIIQGLLSSEVREYKVALEASGINDDILDNIEVTGSGQDIPQSMLFELIPSSLTNLDPVAAEFTTTQAQYKLVWKTGDGDDTFNSTVSGYSGPRQWYYLNAADPMVPYILEQDVDGETYLTATYNNVNVQLQDINIPRRINKDFMMSFTDEVKYDPFAGGSELTSFVSGSPIKRTITMIPNPFAEVQLDSYTQIIEASEEKDVSNESDIWAISFEKLLDETQRLKDFSINDVSFTTQQSVLGEVLTNISNLNVNYDLSTGTGTGKGIPNGDLYSLMNLNKVIKFIGEVPGSVVKSIFSGAYNNIKILSIKKDTLEKTFITSSRLKSEGSSMGAQQIQKLVPSIPYFPDKYMDILIYGEVTDLVISSSGEQEVDPISPI